MKRHRIILWGIFICLLMLLGPMAYGQDSAKDSTQTAEATEYSEAKYYQEDKGSIERRRFSQEEIDEFRADEEYRYDRPPPIESDSLWDRFLRWLSELLFDILLDNTSNEWLRVSIYAVSGGVLLYFLFKLLGVEVRSVFYRRSDGVAIRSDIQEEELHSRDFPKEIQEALAQQRYREAIRLQYLYALRLLSDKGVIRWEIDKTNREYSVEISNSSIKKPFQKVTNIFDRVYYGDFPVSAERYANIASDFEQFQKTISKG